MSGNIAGDTDPLSIRATSSVSHSQRLEFIIDLLKHDARPSFIVNLIECDTYRIAHMPLIYSNPALSKHSELYTRISEDDVDAFTNAKSVEFRYWVTRLAGVGPTNTKINSYVFHDVVWTAVSWTPTYLVVNGLPQETITEAASKQIDVQDSFTRLFVNESVQVARRSSRELKRQLRETGFKNGKLTSPEKRYENEAMYQIPHTPFIDLFYSVDWASTSLGPLELWPDELHQMCTLVMSDPNPAMLFLGDDLLVIHNGTAVQFFPQVQGVLMGSTLALKLPTIWESFETLFDSVKAGRPETIENVPLWVARDGRIDECYVDARYVPILDKTGKFLGVYETIKEVTKENLSRRRLATLLEVSTCASNITEEKLYWMRLLEGLSTNQQDIGFALIYSLRSSAPSGADLTKRAEHKICHLEGLLGLPQDHISAKKTIDLENDEAGYADSFRRAFSQDAPITLALKDGTMPANYLTDTACRGYNSPCQGVVVCPIRPTGATRVVGFLIVGLSSRVAYDDDFRQFLDILNRQIATSVASVALFSEEIARERSKAEEAALARTQLQERLKQKTQELIMSERKFEMMTEKTPIGICIADGLGKIYYANEAFYKITGHPGKGHLAESWLTLLDDDEVPRIIVLLSQLQQGERNMTFEVRMKKKWIRKIEGAEDIRTSTWALVSTFTEVDEDGELLSLFTALTDISAQKWAEEVHRRRMIEALELKRQQEDFIDTISHEIRNPLSAILQSADEVMEYLSRIPSFPGDQSETLRCSVEAMETIMVCCQHQKRIIDDVLTLSKINSDMLIITPDNVDPWFVVNNVVKMFSGDARKQGISLNTVADESLKQMGITYLLFDPNRLSQILINLISNAIKFTRDCAERHINIYVGTSTSRPSEIDRDVEYLDSQPGKGRRDDIIVKNTGRKVFLRIIVEDSGVGMRDDEKRRLFQRFTQASPRTHVRYGGSGLGLFISKRLCELQGGGIGLKMGDERGTTFAFYVSTRQSEASFSVRTRPQSVSHSLKRPISESSISADGKSTFLPVVTKVNPQNTNDSLLVVEDNLLNQKVMIRQLKNIGFTVYSANHGVEALEFLERTRHWKGQEITGKPLSLILLDIEMPIMDGLTCVRRIRQLEAEGVLTAHIPVISVSANARHQQIEEARLAGMDDNVSKPFQIADLVPKIEKLLSATNSHDPS